MNVRNCGLILTVAGVFSFAGHSVLLAQEKAAAPLNLQMEQVVHDYILAHPEVVLESIKNFQLQAQATQKQKTKDHILAHRTELLSDSDSPVLAATAQSGDPVTVVEFFDYRCGYCKKVDNQVTGLAAKPGVRIVYKDFPILGPESLLAAKAALAANKQGAYAPFHHALIEATQPISATLLDQIAGELKLNRDELRKDMSDPAVVGEIDRTLALAQDLGIKSTPSFVIGSSLSSGAMTDEALQAAITTARGEKTNAVATASSTGGL